MAERTKRGEEDRKHEDEEMTAVDLGAHVVSTRFTSPSGAI